MLVSELIAALQKENPNQTVRVAIDEEHIIKIKIADEGYPAFFGVEEIYESEQDDPEDSEVVIVLDQNINP